MSSIPTVQKAWRAHRRGPPRLALSLDDVPVPRPNPRQALVKVEAAALNPANLKGMMLIPNLLAHRPKVVEYDYAGKIVEIGSSFASSGLKVGDKVWGVVDPQGTQGALGQYVVVGEDEVALRPESLDLSLEQAAALGVVGLTAQQALFRFADVKKGQRILIVGGSTSVGILSIQILKHIGCAISASCSTKNVDFVRSLGAEIVYDYTVSPLAKQLLASSPRPTFDAIIDCVGGYDVWRHSESYLAPEGVYVQIGTDIKGYGSIPGIVWGWGTTVVRPTWMGGVKRRRTGMLAKVGKANLQAVYDLVSQGGIAPVVDSVHEFDNALEGYERLGSNHARGKVVIRVP